MEKIKDKVIEITLGHKEQEKHAELEQQKLESMKKHDVLEQKKLKEKKEEERLKKEAKSTKKIEKTKGKVVVEGEEIVHNRVERPAVIKEKVIPKEKEIIQPVIYREREITEIIPSTIQSFEREIRPKEIEEKLLPVEERGTINYNVKGELLPEAKSTFEIRKVEKQVVERPAIIKEYITKREIEIIQPIVEREIISTHEIRTTKPIHEKK